MANIILIAGTYHGGWYWDPITPALTQAGHRVFAPTLSGLDSTSPTLVNLETHINDVLQIVEDNQLEEVVLIGWSYGGMVVTGAADRITPRVQKLIYLDAQLPKPGEREWDLIPDHEHEDFIYLCKDGLNLYPNDGLLQYEPRMRPHPLATKLQPLTYDQGKLNAIEKVFVFAEKWFHDPTVDSPIRLSFDRAKKDQGWTTHSWPYGHDLVREAPEKLLQFLLENLNR